MRLVIGLILLFCFILNSFFFFLGSRNALVSDVENQRQQKLEIDLMVSLMMYQKSFLFVRGFKYFRFFGIAICS